MGLSERCEFYSGGDMARPREFDVEKALDRALEVFWRYGYEGATIPALTKAMGINRPSLYAAFGNKEALFHKALDRYGTSPMKFVADALKEPTARAVVERLFRGELELLTDANNPRGCLVVQSALACGEEAEPVRRELAARREAAVSTLRERFQKAVGAGDLHRATDCAALARFVVTVMNGLAVQAAGGVVPASELRKVVEQAMQAWPG
jgi:AcrR family transcriptional regulator